MEDKELIFELKKLNQIKPDKEWVVLTKKRILGEEKPSLPYLFLKPAYAFLALVLILLISLPVFAQFSLPGHPLYPIKKITERAKSYFVPEKEKPAYQLELVQKRLEELKILAEKNETTKLPSAFKEVKETASQATKNLVKSKTIDPKVLEKSVEVAKIKKEIENKVLATNLGIEEKEDPIKTMVEIIISDFEGRSLTKEQKEIFEKAKLNYQQGNFEEALILLKGLSENR
jgi:hypothetical protein